MLLKYAKLSFRLMYRNFGATVINMLGLSVGFAAFLILWPYAQNELRSDRYHRNSDRIVRLSLDFRWTDDGGTWDGFLAAFNSWGVASEVGRSFPGVEAVTRLTPQLTYNESRLGISRDLFVTVIDSLETKLIFRENQTIFADSNFFQFFTIPLLSGSPDHVLADPNTAVLSATISNKYFGEVSPVGKTIYLNDSIPIRVTGVFQDLPQNTHLRFDIVFSVVGRQGIDISTWNGWTGYCYFRLKDGYSYNEFQKDLDARKAELYSYVRYGCPHCVWSPVVQPLLEVPFSDLRGNSFRSKSKYLLQAMYIVSFIVLALGWANYILLSIHSLNKRLKELGTRKAAGARSLDFSLQFLVDSLIVNGLSLLAALTLTQLLTSPAEEWLGLYLRSWDDIYGAPGMVIASTFILGIIVSALYPLALIRKRSINNLFGSLRSDFKYSPFNSGLIVFQYASAIALIIWAVTSSSQLGFILKKEIGINPTNVVVVEGPAHIQDYSDSRITSFLKDVVRIKGVDKSTVSYSLIGEPDVKGIVLQRDHGSNFLGVDCNGGVSETFLETFELPLVAGRNFMADNPSDRNTVLVSSKLAHRLGFEQPEDAIGRQIMLPEVNKSQVEIIGVFPDYQFRPYYSYADEQGRGIVLMYKNYLIPSFKPLKLSVRLGAAAADYRHTIHQIEELHRSLFPEDTFKWYWLDDRVGQQYRNETIARNQVMVFTILAIFISCLGLLGILSNKVVEKTKEIGIRKVLGARLHQIAQLLLSTTLTQLLVAIVIGIPIAHYLTQQYLQKFSERIHLQWWHYAIPVVGLLIIMFGTVAVVVWKAARRNPVEALKCE